MVSFYLVFSCIRDRSAQFYTMKDTPADDDAQLAQMGHKAELKRNFSTL